MFVWILNVIVFVVMFVVSGKYLVDVFLMSLFFVLVFVVMIFGVIFVVINVSYVFLMLDYGVYYDCKVSL